MRAALLLSLLLVGGQSAALAHAFEHEAGTPQSQSCATCVTAGQLGHGCIDSHMAEMELHSQIAPYVQTDRPFASFDVPTARQRGPPDSL